MSTVGGIEYIDNRLSIPAQWLYEPFRTEKELLPVLISYDNYKAKAKRNKITVTQRGGYGRIAMVAFDSLSSDLQACLISRLGKHPAEVVKKNMIVELLQPDYKAVAYFANYQLPDGRTLPADVQRRYATEAMLLQACKQLQGNNKKLRKTMGSEGNRKAWELISKMVAQLDSQEYPHSLPTSANRLRIKVQEYSQGGYESLISGNWCSANARKVTDIVERLICSIHGDEKLPFVEHTHEIYMQFLAGVLDIADVETGEIFDRKLFVNSKTGAPLTLSTTTIWNIVQNPKNSGLLAKKRMNTIDYNTKMVSYAHRKRPEFALSKISMDDRTLSRKTTSGQWLNSYGVYEPMSECWLGVVYDVAKPSVTMVMDCLRALYVESMQHNLRWAAEVEVENHLMRGLETELNALFQFVTFCNPANSKQKRAEHGIRVLKYGAEKNAHAGIGRHYGKGAFKTKSEHKDDEYKQQRVELETLIADAKTDTHTHNHSPHSIYKDKTRWQVLMEHQHPDLMRPEGWKLLRWIGYMTETTIRNNDCVKLQYEDYYIEHVENLRRLKPNNYGVQAYWLPDAEGNIGECYLYQGDVYVGKAIRYERFNEAKFERTERDEQVRLEQTKRQSHQRKLVKDGVKEKITKVVVINNEQLERACKDLENVKIVETVEREEIDWANYSGGLNIDATKGFMDI